MGIILQVGVHSSLFFGETRGSDTFEGAREAGVNCLELSVGDRGLNPGRPDEVERIRRDLEAAGLRPWSVHAEFGPKLDLSGPYSEARQAGIAAAMLAARLCVEVGGDAVVIHPATGASEDQRPERLRACRESLERLVEQSAHLPVRFALENMLPGHMGDRTSELRTLLEGLPQDRIGFCYDTGHARLCPEGLDVGRCMAGRMITIHLQDNNGERDDHVMPFDGTLDWNAVARIVDEAGYCGPYMFETILPTPEEVIRRARETAQRLHALRAT